MSRVIFKYDIPLDDAFALSLPKGAIIRLVDAQRERSRMWVEHDADLSEGYESRSFRLFGTGHPIPDEPGLEHVGSWISGIFVWHLYESKGDPS